MSTLNISDRVIADDQTLVNGFAEGRVAVSASMAHLVPAIVAEIVKG